MKKFALLGPLALALLAATAMPASAQDTSDDSAVSASGGDQNSSPAGMRERSRHDADSADEEGASHDDSDADENRGYGPSGAGEDQGPRGDSYASGPDGPDIDEDRSGNGYADGNHDRPSDEDDSDDDDVSSSQA